MAAISQFIVGRQQEIHQFNSLLDGQTPFWVLNVYGPGGIGKSVLFKKLIPHARGRDVPVGVLDGSQPDLTPDRVLYGFRESLLEAPSGSRLEDAFRDFDNLFRDYLIVSQILERAGGLNALLMSSATSRIQQVWQPSSGG
jgi:hypothetical protein